MYIINKRTDDVCYMYMVLLHQNEHGTKICIIYIYTLKSG